MTKLCELKKDEYEEFVSTNPYKSHFLQSYVWGQFSKKKKNLIPYYVGLKKENKVVAASLLLKKKLPLGYSYFYAPRGFVMDFHHQELFREMTKEVVAFIKKHKAIFLKIDPDIIRNQYNYLNEVITTDDQKEDIFQMITSCGYKHLGFSKNFETMQPRYTFRIDLTQELDMITNHFSKTTNQRINKARKLGCEVCIGDINDIDQFYHLMTLTENRKDFISYSKDYYLEQYKMLAKQDMATLFLGKIAPKKVIKKLNNELSSIIKELESIDHENTSKSTKRKIVDLNCQKEKLETGIDKYKEYQKKYGEEIILNAHMIITYHDKAWVLYAGNHNILTESYANYLTYFEHIKYCKEKGIKIYDQFGTIGDLDKNNPRFGLHEFKKKFGGDYIEFFGEFDYVLKPLMYFIFTKLVPMYRNIMKKKNKKEINHEIKGNK